MMILSGRELTEMGCRMQCKMTGIFLTKMWLGHRDGQEMMHDGLEGGENEVVDDDKKEGVDDKCEQAEVHVDGDRQDVVQDEQVVVHDGDVDEGDGG